jgi:hypothetical protein
MPDLKLPVARCPFRIARSSLPVSDPSAGDEAHLERGPVGRHDHRLTAARVC